MSTILGDVKLKCDDAKDGMFIGVKSVTTTREHWDAWLAKRAEWEANPDHHDNFAGLLIYCLCENGVVDIFNCGCEFTRWQEA